MKKLQIIWMNATNIKLIVLIATIITGLSSCNKVSQNIPVEGQKYGGGIVLHIFQPNEKGYIPGETHGIIVAEKDLHGLRSFGLCGVNLTGLTSSDIGYGKSNTEAIIQAYPDSASAAKFCAEVKINYYDDWYLPSINELNLIFDKRQSLGTFSTDYTSHYWASTAYDDENYSGAFARFFLTTAICVKDRFELYHIRPVRYF
ncbi:MAG: hypothetical protein ACKO4Y_00420 [Flavobacteriales bacterium]